MQGMDSRPNFVLCYTTTCTFLQEGEMNAQQKTLTRSKAADNPVYRNIDGNHGAFYYKRQMMAKMGREYKSPLTIFRTIRTKQDMDRPNGATDMFFHAR